MSEAMAVQYECTPVYETRYEFGGDKSPTDAVVEALATVSGSEPTDISPLYGSVEPDALDRLFDRPETGSQKALFFSHDGWHVFVRGDGVVIVCDPDEKADPTPLFTG